MPGIKYPRVAAAMLPLSAMMFTPAFGQSSGPETIIVSATRTPQPASKIGSSVTLIDADTIVRAQAISVVDLLVDVPGVSFTRNGGVGSLTSVRIRGAESDQTVLLIDGIKLNDPSSPGGGVDFSNLLVGDLERVEVLRGPQSTLYGSQALGGVINVITKSGDVPFGANLDIEAGDLSSLRARGSIRGTAGRLTYAGALGHVETDGISAAASGRERDGFENDSAQGRLGFALNDALSLDGRIYWSKSRVGIDGFPPPTFQLSDTPEQSETEQLVVYGGATLSMLDGQLRTRFGASQTQIQRDNSNPSLTVPTTFESLGTNNRGEFQTTYDLSPNVQIIGGGEIEESRLRTASPSSFNPNPTPARARTQLGALYVQGQASPTTWLTATLGARWTTNDRFGDAINARATLAGSFNNGTTIVRAAIADGFKAPTPFQLFSDFGNATLLPEEAASVEIGIEQAFFNSRLIGAVTTFKRDTTNQIDFVSCFGSGRVICTGRPFGTYDNVARTSAEGLELSLEAKPIERLRITAGYSNLDARNKVRGSTNFNKRLARRAQDTGFVTIGYDFSFGLDVSATYSATGTSFDNASNSVVLDGYELISVRASQKLSPNWTLYGRIENSADARYQNVAGYNAPPRQAFVGLRAAF